MFIYSLSGLELKDEAQAPVEIEENETTARSGTYQAFGQLFSLPDDDHFEKARDGRWGKELEKAAELLTFPFEATEERIPDSLSKDDYVAEFARLFTGADADARPICSGTYFDDRELNTAEVVRFYEYFGLQASVDDPDRPVDHLATECDFMQYVTFKEAASPSDRLRGSYRRAQLDFHDRQLSVWTPTLAEKVTAADPLPFFAWATELVTRFIDSDHAYLKEIQG